VSNYTNYMKVSRLCFFLWQFVSIELENILEIYA